MIRFGRRSSAFDLRRIAPILALGLALYAGGCAAPEGDRGRPPQGAGLPALLEDLRRHPENRGAGEIYCRQSIARGDSDFPYEAFFAGFFSVPEAKGGDAFCTAIVEAVIFGELTENDIAQFSNRARGKEPLGTLLRKLLAAHLRLSSQTAFEGPDNRVVEAPISR